MINILLIIILIKFKFNFHERELNDYKRGIVKNISNLFSHYYLKNMYIHIKLSNLCISSIR